MSTTSLPSNLSGRNQNFIAAVDANGNVAIGHLSVDSSGNEIGSVSNPVNVLGHASVCASGAVTRPANTTAYVAGQLIANSTTAASVVAIPLTVSRINGGVARILRLGIVKSGLSVANAIFRVHLYASAPAVTNGDGGAWLTSVGGYLGSVDVMIDRVFSDASAGYGAPSTIGGITPMLKPAPGSQIIYALIEACGGYVPDSGETFTVEVEIVQD